MADEILEAIEAAEAVLATTTSEDQVLAKLHATLEELRSSYAHDATPFTPALVKRLQVLSAIERAVDMFVTIRADLTSVEDLDDYRELRRELVRLERSVGAAAVRQRIDKEIRQLDEQKGSFELASRDRAEIDERGRLNAIARHPPKCVASAHDMVLLTSPQGRSYWRCKAYPICEHRQSLSPDERAYLAGDEQAFKRLNRRWHAEEQANNPFGL